MEIVPPLDLSIGGFFHEGQLGIADDTSQDIVEVVGNTPGKGPDRLDPLGL
jgi:hypothetical protein